MDEKEKELLEGTALNETEEDDVQFGEKTTYIATEENTDCNFNEAEENGCYTENSLTFSEAGGKRKTLVQKPIIIAALCFIVTALLLAGTALVYNIISDIKSGREAEKREKARNEITSLLVFSDETSAWKLIEVDGNDISNGHIYARFADSENVNLYMEGDRIFGKYTAELNDEGEKVIKSDFYIFASSGGEGLVTYDDSNETLTLTFESGVMKFQKSTLPVIDLDPNEITHASADEAGITEVTVDEKLVGEWKELMDDYYIENGYVPQVCTFNSDGSGSISYEYTYYDAYKYGYGTETKFRYTAKDGNIYMTRGSLSGELVDVTVQYGFNGENLVIGGIGYEKVN